MLKINISNLKKQAKKVRQEKSKKRKEYTKKILRKFREEIPNMLLRDVKEGFKKTDYWIWQGHVGHDPDVEKLALYSAKQIVTECLRSGLRAKIATCVCPYRYGPSNRYIGVEIKI